MTVASTTRKAGPYTGNGVATSFAFAFKVFTTADISVVKANSVGTESTLVIDSDYSVTLNADQTANPGGSITYPLSGSPLAAAERLAILGGVAYNQTTSLPNGGAYNASIVERALDRLTILIQQILEIANRGVRLAATAASNVSGTLPTPIGDNLIGWNSDATALIDIPVSSLATTIQANTWAIDRFNGTGAQTVFVLTSAPGNVKAIIASVGGAVQVPDTNFSLVGSTVTFLTGAPPAGTNNVVFQYGQTVQTLGTADLGNTTGTLPVASGGTGATTVAAARAALGDRVLAAGNVTLYVATTGSDSNNGLTVGTPFLTIQKAYDTFYKTYDMAGFTPTIQLADGTYTAGLSAVQPVLGVPSLGVIINGNSGTPANVIVNTTSANAITAAQQAVITTQNMELRTTTSGSCVQASFGGVVFIGAGMRFGTCAANHIFTTLGGVVRAVSNYSIVGSASAGSHLFADQISQISYVSITVTVTGTPAFSTFALNNSMGLIYARSVTFSGAATGTRYSAAGNSVIDTAGGGASYFPGNVAGSTATGGQYI